MNTIVLIILIACLLVSLFSGLLLAHMPKEKILRDNVSGDLYVHVPPPRHALNKLGKTIDSVFKTSGIIMIIVAIIGFLLE